MTVITDVKQTIAGLKGIQASFEQFSLATDNKQAKQMYATAAEQATSILNLVEPRVQEILKEEPQYREL